MRVIKNLTSLKLLTTVLAAATVPFAGVALADNGATVGETEYRWETNMRGKPPYKRERVAIETIDVAAMEISTAEVPTEVVRQRSFNGRPPFKRQTVELPVVDTASIELIEAPATSTDFRGRPPFKRHR